MARIDVLNRGYVALVDRMPSEGSGDAAIVNAARVSYNAESKGEERDRRLIRFLLKHRHTSPLEHVVFTFEVNAPALVWWQWVRHRTWSYNFVSGRYVEHDESDVYVPDEWRRQAAVNRQASDGPVDSVVQQEARESLEDMVQEGFYRYRRLLELGVAREMARLVLPAWSLYYRAICTVDLHNLMHFVRLRRSEDAQWEIAQYANALWTLVRSSIPWTAEEFDGGTSGEQKGVEL